MKNKDLKKSIFEKIKNENIKQKPKLYFIVKNYIFWLFVIVSIIISSIAISVIILSVFQMDIQIAERASGGLFRHIMLFTPYKWLLILSLFVILGLGNFIYTKHGYRYKLVLIIFIIVIMSVLSGVIIYSLGGAHKIESRANKFGGNYYSSLESRREQMWTQADRGLLAGVPLNTTHDDLVMFDLVDFNGKTWVIDAHRLESRDRSIIAVAGKVAIIGIVGIDGVFEACRIIPWERLVDRPKMLKDILEFDDYKSIDERNIFELRSNVCK